MLPNLGISVAPHADKSHAFMVHVRGTDKELGVLNEAVDSLVDSRFDEQKALETDWTLYVVTLSESGRKALLEAAVNDARVAAAIVRKWIVEEYERLVG